MRGDLVKLALDGHFGGRTRLQLPVCNGCGIAKAIKQAFPEAYKADKDIAKGHRTKLEKLSIATIELGNREITIVNGYTQFHWRGSGVWVGDKDGWQYFCFDVLHIDGVDLKTLPLSERRKDLERLCRKARVPFMKMTEQFPDGLILFQYACAYGFEGVVSKRLASRYSRGPSRGWLKSNHRNGGETTPSVTGSSRSRRSRQGRASASAP
jgi:hypothetical protein